MATPFLAMADAQHSLRDAAADMAPDGESVDHILYAAAALAMGVDLFLVAADDLQLAFLHA